MPQKKAQTFVRFGKRSQAFEPSEKIPRPFFNKGDENGKEINFTS
jgi:hypothetical protein